MQFFTTTTILVGFVAASFEQEPNVTFEQDFRLLAGERDLAAEPKCSKDEFGKKVDEAKDHVLDVAASKGLVTEDKNAEDKLTINCKKHKDKDVTKEIVCKEGKGWEWKDDKKCGKASIFSLAALMFLL
jgi:hypothetical protein